MACFEDVSPPCPSPLPAKRRRENISRLDLRVGKVTHVQEHPLWRKWYLIHVDIGSRIHRRSITRLAPFQGPVEILSHKVVVVCNMKRNVRGLLSDCFVLYAKYKDYDNTEYIRPPAKAQPGDRVFAPGYPFDPLQDWPFLPGGTALFKAATRKMRASTKGIVKYNQTPLTTEHGGQVTTCEVKGARIRI